MQDPRLVEIDFLMDLEREGQLNVRSVASDDRSGVERHTGFHRYGFDAVRFRDMILGLILQGHIVGQLIKSEPLALVDQKRLSHEKDSLINQLVGGRTFAIHLSHAGRTHLWNTRDELMKNPELDAFGLLNKQAWHRDLFLRLRWASETEPLSIIWVDLDHFGRVNKDLGHAIGDEVLRQAFAAITRSVGQRGTVYRAGGEEVGVLMPRTPPDIAEATAEEIRASIERDVVAEVPRLDRPQTASLGVVTVHAAEPDAFDRVDRAQRRAKTSGRNRVEIA